MCQRHRGLPMDVTSLFISGFAGLFGVAYFIYGKKQQRPVPMLAGAALCVIPYFIGNVWILSSVCAALLIVPFVIRVEL